MYEIKEIGWTSHRDKVIYEDGIYHITQRAPGKEILFAEDNDYVTFLYLLEKYAMEFKLDIFAFCLMLNHLHLLLKISKKNLKEAMHALFTAYAMRYNAKYKRKGHVFCGVYRGALCQDDAHLIGSSLYIHLNPVKAGIVKDAADYRWSSASLYTNNHKKTLNPFVNKNYILGMIDDDFDKATSLYREMLKESTNAEYENILEKPNAAVCFTKSIIDKFSGYVSHKKINKDFIQAEKNIDSMIEEIRNTGRSNITGPSTAEAISYLIEQLKSRGFNMTYIAKTLKINRSTLYKFNRNR